MNAFRIPAPSLRGRAGGEAVGLALFLLACSGSSSYAQTALYPDAFPLGDVTLLDGPLKHARDLNVNGSLPQGGWSS